MLIYLIISLSFQYAHFSKMISQPFLDSFGIPSARIDIGDPPQKKYLDFDMEIQYNWMNDRNYDANQSTTLLTHEKKLIRIEHTTADAVALEDKFYFPNEKESLIHFHFYYVHNTFAFTGGCISLTYQHENQKYSLVHQLYKHKLIDHLSFSFADGAQEKGIITFGGITDDIIIKNKYKGFCNVKDKPYWSCDLHSISNGIYTYYNSDSMMFQSGESDIHIPKEFFEFLKSTVFKKYLENEECALYKFTIDYVIRCNEEVLETLPPFKFLIGNYQIEIPHNMLFTDMFDKKQLRFFQPRTDQEHLWIIGMPFFRSNDVLFDYENKTVSFFGNNTITYVNNSIELQKIITVFEGGILLAFSIFLFLIQYLNKNNINLYW